MKAMGKFIVLLAVALAIAPQLSSARGPKESNLSPILAGEEVGAKYQEMLRNFWRIAGIAMKLGIPLCPFLASDEDCANSPPLKLPLSLIDPGLDGTVSIKMSSIALSFDKKPLDVSFASIKYHGQDMPLKWEWEYVLPAVGVEIWYNYEGVLFGIPMNRTGTLFAGLENIYLYHTADMTLKDPIKFDEFDFKLAPLNVAVKPNNLIGIPVIEEMISKAIGEAIMAFEIEIPIFPGLPPLKAPLKDLLHGLIPVLLSGTLTETFPPMYAVWFQRMEWDAKFFSELIGKPLPTQGIANTRTRFLY